MPDVGAYRTSPVQPDDCDHGVTFPTEREAESAALRHLSATEVRECFPRLFGECPKLCGYNGIAYASRAHYVAGDW